MRVWRSIAGTLAVGAAAMAMGAGLPEDETVLESFEAESLPPNMKQNNATARLVPWENERALHVDFAQVDWPNVFFSPGGEPWDWSRFAGIAIDIHNPESEPIKVCMRVDNAGADGASNCITQSYTAMPGKQGTMVTRFRTDAGPFWGMRGVPVWGPLANGKPIDPSRIVAFQVFLPRPSCPHSLVLDNIRLFGRGGSLEELVPLPFVDRFGQYRHEDWPGKIQTEDQLVRSARDEQAAFEARPEVAGRDRFGGWAGGPQLDATGWFRTEQVDGKWWLVTPEGRLFFSLGVDCVGTWERTFVEKREPWFEWLPDRESENPYRGLYSFQRGAHSMADPVGGEGWTFSFYCANLIRKHGEGWPDRWRETSYKRLRSWGFNTVAMWSQGDVLDNSPMPFVGSASVGGDVRRIEGGLGYWSKMFDVFDPSFAKAAGESIPRVTQRFADNPLCIGYYADNELSWHGIPQGALASPPGQPCRAAFVEDLTRKYGSLSELNAAWSTSASSWEALRAPEAAGEEAASDFEAFTYRFARRYFDTVNSVLKRHAPNQLYLGCRFAGPPEEAVMKACGEVADVMSFNLYYTAIDVEEWARERDFGKPAIIGEFHFGALDRGMFHTGLQATRSQQERADAYRRYVRSVAEAPTFVGCHWFQYVDEPITGRWFDGENYNIGFVSVTDTPYRELVDAAREVHAEVYPRRYGNPPEAR